MKRFLFLMLLLAASPSRAEEKMLFALVPKLQHPFFELAHDGCLKAAEENRDIECLYIGPTRSSEEEQIQIIQDLIARRVNGIAVAPANAPAMARVLKAAKGEGIPVITFDSDLLEKDRSLRMAYVGTKNYDIGVELAKRLIDLHPEGGLLAIQSGHPASANLQERIRGLRDTLAGKGWVEAEGTPVYCSDDTALAVQQMEDILGKYPDLEAFVAVGGWPQFAQRGYKMLVQKYKERVLRKELIIVAADTLPMQMEILKEGLSHGQIGQRPFDMGYRSMLTLKALVRGETVPDLIYTGLDICTQQTADSCVAGK